VEAGGSKSVVFCGGSTYKVSMCFDHFPPFLWEATNDPAMNFGRLPFPALAYLTEFSALILLLSVAAFPRPFGQIDHFDRSVLYPICLDFSLD
jgi:hypothetical protein